MAGQGDRTEKPTQKRINKAHDQGQVIRSVEAAQAISLTVFYAWTAFAGARFMAGMLEIVRSGIVAVGRPEDTGRLTDDLFSMLWRGAVLLGPLLVALMIFSVGGTWIQGGFHPREGLIKFELGKLNPLKGIKGLVSVEKLVAAGKAILRTALYTMIALAVVRPEWTKITGLALMTPAAIFETTLGICGRVLWRALLVGIVLGGLDYGLTRWRYFKGLRMTKQEVKDEHKENENPEIKGRIRRRQREVFRRRLMDAVRGADVVVTNPTHVAVALKYDRLKMAAPVVVAKGRDLVALRMKEEAAKANVPILEDPPLARLLERLCPEGAPVPELLYRAVAEVFAHVFRRRRGGYRPRHGLADVERTLGATGRLGPRAALLETETP